MSDYMVTPGTARAMAMAPRATPFQLPSFSAQRVQPAQAQFPSSNNNARRQTAQNLQPAATGNNRENLPEYRTDRRMNADQYYDARLRREAEAQARRMSLSQYSQWLRSQANITPEVQAELNRIGNQIGRAVSSGASGRERVDDLNTLREAATRRIQSGLSAVEPERAARVITGTAPEGSIINPSDLANAKTKDQSYAISQHRDNVLHEAQLRRDLENPNLSDADRRRIEAELEDIGSYNLVQGYMLGLAGAAGQRDERLAPITEALASQRDPVTGEAVDITSNNPSVNPSWKIEDGPSITPSTQTPSEVSGDNNVRSAPQDSNAGPVEDSNAGPVDAGPDLPIEEALEYIERNPEFGVNFFDFLEALGKGYAGNTTPTALDERRRRYNEVRDAERDKKTEQEKMKTIADIEKEQQEAERAFRASQAALDRAADMAQLERQIAAQRQLEMMRTYPGTGMVGAGVDPRQAMRAQAYAMFGMPAYPTVGATGVNNE